MTPPLFAAVLDDDTDASAWLPLQSQSAASTEWSLATSTGRRPWRRIDMDSLNLTWNGGMASIR